MPSDGSRKLIDEYPLLVLPSLACTFGLIDGIFLQQIHFWLTIYEQKQDPRHYHAGRWWVYNTIEEWHDQMPFLSLRTIARVVQRSQDRAILITANYNLWSYDHTLWYTLDYQHINDLVDRWQRKRAHKRAHRSCQVGMIEQAKLALSIMPDWHDRSCQDGMMYHRSTTETSTETTQIWHTALSEIGLLVGKSVLPQIERMRLVTLDDETATATVSCNQPPDPHLAALIARVLADLTGQEIGIEWVVNESRE